MQLMFHHINRFSNLLHDKGYDNNFHSPYGFYDRIRDNLTKHVLQCYEDKRAVESLNIASYTHWKDRYSPYVRCDFQMTYSSSVGFSVTHMNIEYGNAYGMLRNKGVVINRNEDIPEKSVANQMALKSRTKRIKV